MDGDVPQERDGRQSVGSRALRGVFWAYASYVGGRLLVLASIAVLAHLLDPREFGLVALALLFTTFLSMLSDLGVSQALVVVDVEDELERAETVFAVSVLVGLGLWLVTVGLAPLAASFFDEPALTGLLAALGANLLLRSFGSTHYALAQKRLDFKSRAAAEFADVGVRGAVGIICALLGAGAWSLVLGYLAGTIALNVVLLRLVRWRPRWRPRREHVRDLVGFGGALTGVNVVAAVQGNIDYGFVGRILGPAALGLYTLGYRIPELVVLGMSTVAGRVLFPAFAAVEPARLGAAFLTALRYMLLLGAPLTAILVILSEPLVLALFGEKWRGSVDAMQVLGVYAFLMTLGIPAGNVYKVIGRVSLLLFLSVPWVVVLTVSLALFTSDGIVAAALCQAVAAGVFALVGIALACRLLTVEVRGVLRAVKDAVLVAAMGAVPPLVTVGITDDVWLALIAGGSLGAAGAVAGARLFAPELLTDLTRRIRGGMIGAPPAASVAQR